MRCASCYGRLVELRSGGRRAVIAIDEAQTITPEALAEVRALSNLEHEDARLLTIVLIGSPRLEATLAGDPDLLARVELRVRLEALARDDAHAYLAHRLEVAGGDPKLFAEDVLDAIVERAGGLPRRLNALADGTLFEAHLAGRVGPACADVERAARDLPWGETAGRSATFSRAPVPVEVEKEDDALSLDDVFEADASIESLRDVAASASLRDLDLPDLGTDLGADIAEDLESALTDDPADVTGARRSRTLERAAREQEIAADLIGPEETSPGAWHTAAPVEDDDEITASREPGVPRHGRDQASLLPDADELDGLFVDLVDEAEPKR